MSDITDPIAVKFCNEVVRPIAEQLRALGILASNVAVKTAANGGQIAAFFGVSNSDVVVDGRAAEGVRQLTSLEINQVLGIIAAVGAAINPQIVEVACVRALQVT